MNEAEATEEVRKRWGKDAFVGIKVKWVNRGLDKVVGIREKNKEVIKGTGATFEQAIAFADKIESLII